MTGADEDTVTPSEDLSTGQGMAATEDAVTIVAGDELDVAVQQLGEQSPALVGWFRYYFGEQRWEWSDQVQQLHGYQPGTVTPTTALVLSHKHPEDRDKLARTIDAITHSGGALSSRHRIIDTTGAVHWVVVIGDQFFDDTGAVIGTHGFYVDVTRVAQLRQHAQQHREDLLTARVDEITTSRATIEQVKGMLMLIYNIDADTAFDVLRWLSQEHNVKLRMLTDQLGIDLSAAARGVEHSDYDHILLTAHRRIATDHSNTAD
jgi:hypothetical protein